VVNKILLLLLFSFFISCGNNRQEKKLSDAEIKDRMANVNKILVRDESKDIDEFIEKHQWKMQTTGTGLRIQIYDKGEGRQPKQQETVAIAYNLYLLDGTECYSADENKPLKFILGRNQQTAGLEEGLMLMHEGERARMVVPSHLAYGIAGDENKIPAGSALYYDVKLLTVNSH
jgi:FKBP-type peptidyl-prolyl cis-trans isomerase FkpA